MLDGDKNYGEHKADKEDGVFTILNRLVGKNFFAEWYLNGNSYLFECDTSTYRHFKFKVLILISLFSPLKLALSVVPTVAIGTTGHQLLKLES